MNGYMRGCVSGSSYIKVYERGGGVVLYERGGGGTV